MGKVSSKVARNTVHKYNAENRANRVIEKAESFKPIPAPRHATTVDILHKLQKDHPEWLDAQKSKHAGLNERLKGMVVNPDKFGELKSKRMLPEFRGAVEDQEFGYLEPSYIRPGHFSIRQSLDFISRHQANPKVYKASNVAEEFKLDIDATTDVLKYFQTFQVQLPKELAEKIGEGQTRASNESILTKPDAQTLIPGGVKKS